jgi:hypothetical protein
VRGVDVLGQRQLHQDAVYAVISVEPGDQRQQLGLGGLLGQAMVKVYHAELGRQLALAAHIDLASRIGADQHGSETRRRSAVGNQIGHALAHSLAQPGREYLAIDQFCFSHAYPPFAASHLDSLGKGCRLPQES